MPQIKQEVQLKDQELELITLNKTYRELKQIVSEWQEERGAFWTQYLTFSDSLPYIKVSELPIEGVVELTERMLQKIPLSGGREGVLSQEKLQHVVQQILLNQLVEDSELYSRLFMALSGMLDLARRHLPETTLKSTKNLESLLCPVCGQGAGIAVLLPPVGKRFSFCTACGHEWTAKRVGCIRCGSEEAARQSYLESDRYPGVEMVVCQECGESFKEIDLRTRAISDLVWEDLRTLPLNYAAEQWLKTGLVF